MSERGQSFTYDTSKRAVGKRMQGKTWEERMLKRGSGTVINLRDRTSSNVLGTRASRKNTERWSWIYLIFSRKRDFQVHSLLLSFAMPEYHCYNRPPAWRSFNRPRLVTLTGKGKEDSLAPSLKLLENIMQPIKRFHITPLDHVTPSTPNFLS